MYKLLSFVIIWASLVLGLIAALTSYVPTVDSLAAAKSFDETATITLNADAGGVAADAVDENGDPLEPQPALFTDDTEVSLADLESLQAADVPRASVKEFAFGRWTGRWMFLIAVVGLVGGALLARLGQRQALAAADQAGDARETSPHLALAESKTMIEQLREEIRHVPDEPTRLNMAIEQLGLLQREQFVVVAEAREQLIGAFGMSNYAQLMDRFAAFERIVNRAWSAAADGEVEEMMFCLDVAAERVDDAIEKLPEQTVETPPDRPMGMDSPYDSPE